MDARHIIKRPIITEKSNLSKEFAGHHVFEVSKDANKIEIRKAVEQLLGVKVSSVNTSVTRGKTKRMGRHFGQRSNFKKAVVTLAPGEEVEFFEALEDLDELEAAEE